ncbi:TPA: hypothetical protein ACP41M_001089 [Klebsiella aerogenes]
MICSLPLDMYADAQHIAQWFDTASSPFAAAAEGGVKVLTAQDALKMIADAKISMDGLASYYQNAVEQLSLVNFDEVSASEIKDFAVKYEYATKMMTSLLAQLKLMFVYAEASPMWLPHQRMLREYTRPAIRTMANLRNLFDDTAMLLRNQMADADESSAIAPPDMDSVKALIERSHKKYNLPAPKWS